MTSSINILIVFAVWVALFVPCIVCFCIFAHHHEKENDKGAKFLLMSYIFAIIIILYEIFLGIAFIGLTWQSNKIPWNVASVEEYKISSVDDNIVQLENGETLRTDSIKVDIGENELKLSADSDLLDYSVRVQTEEKEARWLFIYMPCKQTEYKLCL